MIPEQCGSCRFWILADDASLGIDTQPYGWGWCRRNPPQLSERMSGMLIPSLGNREDNYDPEDVATAQNVADCSLFPATWHDKWCGQYEPHFRPVAVANDRPEDAMLVRGREAFHSARSELREEAGA